MISQAIQIGVVLDPVFPEPSPVANNPLQQIKSRVAFSQATINARDVVQRDRVFLLDGFSSPRPIVRPVLLTQL
jgi:hypothetical protein